MSAHDVADVFVSPPAVTADEARDAHHGTASVLKCKKASAGCYFTDKRHKITGKRLSCYFFFVILSCRK